MTLAPTPPLWITHAQLAPNTSNVIRGMQLHTPHATTAHLAGAANGVRLPTTRAMRPFARRRVKPWPQRPPQPFGCVRMGLTGEAWGLVSLRVGMLCLHDVTELRERPTATGTSQWAHQCVTCGVRVGNWVKRPTENAPAWDAAAEEAAARRRPNTLPDANVEQQARDVSWRRVYESFIKSPQWRAMRAKVLERAGGRCEGCLTARADQVHHTRYPSGDVTLESFTEQPLWELRAICYTCHANQHPHMREAA